MTDDFFQDLAWFQLFLPQFNGTTKFGKPILCINSSVHLDVCLTGVEAIWENRVYAAPAPSIPGFILKIVHLEMINIVIALRMWGKYWRHS